MLRQTLRLKMLTVSSYIPLGLFVFLAFFVHGLKCVILSTAIFWQRELHQLSSGNEHSPQVLSVMKLN